MKLYLIIILFFINNCSFDNKTGIWNSEEILSKKKEDVLQGFKKLTDNEKNFNEVINLKENYNFSIPRKVVNIKWRDLYYSNSNNLDNFSHKGELNFLLSSRKLSRYKLNNHILYDKGNFFLSDQKGNILIYSENQKKVISKYNFYKKNFRKINKKLNLILDKNTIYATDNIGYVYAYEYKKNKILWAKNTKIPFRSNLKIKNNKLIAADEKNNFYLFDKANGNLIKMIPSEETLIKNNFINNFSLSSNYIFALNTYGSLFAIEHLTNEIKWVQNLNKSYDLSQINLFKGKPLINNDKFIIVSSQDSTYIINLANGNVLHKFNIISQVKPLLTSENLFLISKNNLLICIDVFSGKIIYSYDINKKISKYLKKKKQKFFFNDIALVNDKIFVLFKNEYLAQFEINGNLKEIKRLKKKVNSNLLFIENLIIYLEKKRLIFLN